MTKTERLADALCCLIGKAVDAGVSKREMRQMLSSLTKEEREDYISDFYEDITLGDIYHSFKEAVQNFITDKGFDFDAEVEDGYNIIKTKKGDKLEFEFRSENHGVEDVVGASPFTGFRTIEFDERTGDYYHGEVEYD